MNGYFQLIVNGNATFMKVFPATGGGEPASLQEAMNYLAYKKIPYDIKMLGQYFNGGDYSKPVILNRETMLPVAESCIINCDPDFMGATARFYPASNGGRELDKEGIMSECRLNKITYGADEEVIESYLKDKKYCTDYRIAKGTPVLEGKDAYITYFFNTDNKIRPALNEDGTVDFHNLNLVNHCKEGELLAELTPEVKGTPGKDIRGNEIRPRDVKRAQLSYGLNIQLSEDRLRLTSKVNGHVNLTGGRVFVSDVMEVVNVDNSTGDIEYESAVLIQGNVNSGFSVRTKGDIEVRGTVEGAILEAGGNIVLQRGINGMGKGRLKAGGNIIAKFMENCTAEAGGYIETNSILHSTVSAGTDINVMSKKGFITGGSVTALSTIRVKTLGSTMGADTSVTVGVNPQVLTRIGQLNKEVTETEKNLKTMLPVLDAAKKRLAAGEKFSAEKIKQIQLLAQTVKQAQEVIANSGEELQTLKNTIDEGQSAAVEVKGEVFPGVVINISDVSMIIKESYKYCRFIKDKGDVRMAAL
ncbi:MAG: FapA family protein [Lachnospiraceae bacterium]|nr:FapA family protein [Lachnospiraceae bacterium]